jgi:hypothetical protein
MSGSTDTLRGFLRLASAAAVASISIASAAAALAQSTRVPATPTRSDSFLEQGYDAYATYGVFPSEPLASLTVQFALVDWNYGGTWKLGPTYGACEPVGDTAAVFDQQMQAYVFAEGSAGGLTRSQNVLRCSWFTHEPASAAEPDWFVGSVIEARNGASEDVAVDVCVTDYVLNPASVGPAQTGLCGDFSAPNGISANDALFLLQRATDPDPSDVDFLDVNRDALLTASDALAVLRAAVGLPAALLCNPTFCW